MACCWEDFLFLMVWHWREPRTSLFPSNTSFLNDRGTFAHWWWSRGAELRSDCNQRDQFKTELLSKSIVTNPDVVALCYLLSINFWCEGQYAAQWGRIKTQAWWVGGFTNHRCFYFEALCWLSSGKHHSLERKDNILRILSPAKKTFPSTAQNPEKTHVQPYYLLWKQPDSAVQGVVEDWGHK